MKCHVDRMMEDTRGTKEEVSVAVFGNRLGWSDPNPSLKWEMK